MHIKLLSKMMMAYQRHGKKQVPGSGTNSAATCLKRRSGLDNLRTRCSTER
jgi:hypothetical protein